MKDLSRRYESVRQFDRLYRKGFFKRLLGTLYNHRNRLIPFREIREIIGAGAEHHAGIQTVDISKVIGSENRFEDFDRAFLPLNKANKAKWINVNTSLNPAGSWPLVSLYKVGDYYFVQDGHHRISVARNAGQRFIDAEVIELKVPADLPKSYSPEEFFLHLEERMFHSRTGLSDIHVTIPGGYLELLRLIGCFRCSRCHSSREIQKQCPDGIPWRKAIQGWYQNCFSPAVQEIEKSGIIQKFKGKTSADLYLWTLANLNVLRKAACFVPSSQEVSKTKKGPASFYFFTQNK